MAKAPPPKNRAAAVKEPEMHDTPADGNRVRNGASRASGVKNRQAAVIRANELNLS